MVMKHHHGPVLRRKSSKGLLEQVSITYPIHLVRRDVGWSNGTDTSRRPAFCSRLDITCMDDEPMEPGFEPLRISERGQVAPCAQQRLLRRVLGAVMVTEDAVGEAIAPIDRGVDEGREGVAIASARPYHEVDLHGDVLEGAARLAASVSMEPARGQTFRSSAREALLGTLG